MWVGNQITSSKNPGYGTRMALDAGASEMRGYEFSVRQNHSMYEHIISKVRMGWAW